MAFPTITFYSEVDNTVETNKIDPLNALSLSLLFDLLKLHYRCGQRVYVRCCDQQQMLEIDEQLWTTESHSFLAHSLDGETSAAKAPIVLGTNIPDNIGGFFCWVNLTESALLPLPNTKEIIEIVSDSERERQLARERYKMYCKNGIKPAFVKHSTEKHKCETLKSFHEPQVEAHV